MQTKSTEPSSTRHLFFPLRRRFLAIGIVASIAAAAVFLLQSRVWPRQIAFARDQWVNQRDSDGNGDERIRARMVNDLLASHRLIGMTRTEIYDLLGDPDYTIKRNTEIAYRLRYISTLSGVSKREYLIVEFTALDRVSSIEIDER